MPLFQCEACKCVENTALSPSYWSRDMDIWPPEARGKKLCSECAPTTFSDGSPVMGAGKWHGRFPKRPAAGMLIDQDGYLWSQEQVDAGMLPRLYKIVGRVE